MFPFLLPAQQISMSGVNHAEYVGISTDSPSGTTAANYDILVSKPYLYYYDVQVTLDTVAVTGLNPDFTVALYGSNDDTKFYIIGSSVNWGAVYDTTIRFTNLTAAEVVTDALHTETLSGTLINASHTETVSGKDSIDAFNVYNYQHITTNYDTLLYPKIIQRDGRVNTVAQQTYTDSRVNTVAAQTLTKAEGGLIWKYLRVVITGSGSTARATLNRIEAAILPKNY
jgi:hypothetical protein